MSHLDRLSSLVNHFEIHTQETANIKDANLVIVGGQQSPKKLIVNLKPNDTTNVSGELLAALKIDFGGQATPVLDALPDKVEVDLEKSMELSAIAQLIMSEIEPRRCGGQFALNRLCEFLMVNLLRNQIENKSSESGVLAGLAHPNLSPPIVAMHDTPGKNWRLDDLVQLSGMSRSQFISEFQVIVGRSPMAYLKQWRMTLARNALLNGERVKETARKFGYGSGDAFTRAFTNEFGVAPTKINNPQTTLESNLGMPNSA